MICIFTQYFESFNKSTLWIYAILMSFCILCMSISRSCSAYYQSQFFKGTQKLGWQLYPSLTVKSSIAYVCSIINVFYSAQSFIFRYVDYHIVYYVKWILIPLSWSFGKLVECKDVNLINILIKETNRYTVLFKSIQSSNYDMIYVQ